MQLVILMYSIIAGRCKEEFLNVSNMNKPSLGNTNLEGEWELELFNFQHFFFAEGGMVAV